jgi:hypothetical protein
MRGAVAASLTALRNHSLRQAEATVVVGDLVARKVTSLGAPSARVHVITNWCNDEVIRPVAQSENPLRQTWGLAGQFVLGYSGNLGRAHEFRRALVKAEAAWRHFISCVGKLPPDQTRPSIAQDVNRNPRPVLQGILRVRHAR